MNLSAQQMATALISIYEKVNHKYYLSKKTFRAIANRDNLRNAFLWEINSELHKEGYTLIDLRGIPGKRDYIAVIKVRVIVANWKLLTRRGIKNLKLIFPGKSL